MNNDVTLILTTPEAMMFRDFQKYHEVFELMIKSGVFDIRYGNCTLNFADGQLMNITKNEIVWKK